MSEPSGDGAKPLSAHVCATLSIVISLGSIGLVFTTLRSGGEWLFSMLACFVPLFFAAQGFRMSRLPDAKFPTFSLVGSLIGAALGLVAFVGFALLLTHSS